MIPSELCESEVCNLGPAVMDEDVGYFDVPMNHLIFV